MDVKGSVCEKLKILSVASIRKKLLKTTYTEERRVCI